MSDLQLSYVTERYRHFYYIYMNERTEDNEEREFAEVQRYLTDGIYR